MKRLLLIPLLFLAVRLNASDIVWCGDDGSFQGIRFGINEYDFGLINDTHTLIYSLPPSPIRPLKPYNISGVPFKYIKCADTDADTQFDSIVEMSLGEKRNVEYLLTISTQTSFINIAILDAIQKNAEIQSIDTIGALAGISIDTTTLTFMNDRKAALSSEIISNMTRIGNIRN